MRLRYSTAELCFALKPWVIRHLLEKFPDEAIYYFDSDIELFTPLAEVEAALAHGANIVLTPHILQPAPDQDSEEALLRSGSLNAGFLAVAPTAEGHGFVGAMGVLLLYFIVLMRLTQNAQTAPDRAGTFLVMGVVAVLTFHILVNVGMVLGFMPVTGIPLPLMSYGGSSVLFMFLALGMVMNVRMRRFVN